uniref:vomeronasal type-2 receptor 116-like n=1 Tax=Jaculus jaculus TaxID=51337 RepID=UPI001E1B2819|nr:vomeronasal type-2 receptor 116-like [Jaculus jaculus]
MQLLTKVLTGIDHQVKLSWVDLDPFSYVFRLQGHTLPFVYASAHLLHRYFLPDQLEPSLAAFFVPLPSPPQLAKLPELLLPAENWTIQWPMAKNKANLKEFALGSHTSYHRLPIRRFHHVLALIFALEDVNHNSQLLHNASLKLHSISKICQSSSFYAGEDKLPHEVRDSPNYMCEQKACQIALTGPSWAGSASLGPLMQLYVRPQISYGPFHIILSDREKFPYLYQVAPKDANLPLAMVSLMYHFRWAWVELVISDDDQGFEFLYNMRTEMKRYGICLANVNMIPANINIYLIMIKLLINTIFTSSANAVVIYGNIHVILEVGFLRWECLDPRRIWITTSQWDLMPCEVELIPDSFRWSFMFLHHHGEIFSIKTFIQTMKFSKHTENFNSVKSKWMSFNCSLSKSYYETLNNYSSNPSLEWFSRHRFDMAMDEECYNIYNAVYAVAHAFHEMIIQQVDSQRIGNEFMKSVSCTKVHAFLKNMHFTSPIGDVVNMNQKGQENDKYDVFNVWNFPHGIDLKMKIGQFSPHFQHGEQLYLFEDMAQWATGRRQILLSVCSVPCRPGFRKSHQEGQAACCFNCYRCPKNEISNETDMEQCVKCPDDQYANVEQTHCLQKSVTYLAYADPLGITLSCLALAFSALTCLVLGVFWKHQDTPIVKANNRTLSYILLISLKCCFFCSLLFIGRPNTATCILQQITFGVLFTVAVSTVLAKTVTVVLAFKVTAPGRRMRGLLLSGVPNLIIPTCTLIQLIFCAVWLGTSPPFIDTDAHSEHGHITIVCNKGSVTAFYCVLGFLGSLAIVSFTVAFLARNLPDTFNEAKFLTFSMLVFCSVWLTFLPVYQSSHGKFMVAVEVFSILASSAGLLGCIFVPKCYIILLRPDRIALHKIRDKTNS